MKIDTLRRVFARSRRVKLHLCWAGRCLTVIVSSPRVEDDGLDLRVEASICCDLRSGALTENDPRLNPLRLQPDQVFTRRIQTHRRHLEGHAIPPEYFRRALELRRP